VPPAAPSPAAPSPAAPSPAALRRAAGLAGPGATVRDVRALPGGTHAATFLIRTTNPALEAVLREFPPGDDAPRAEARVLAALDGLGGLAPRLLAEGPGDDLTGGSWLLISRLPGTAGILPARPAAWAAQLGEALARVHAASGPWLAGFRDVFGRPGGSPAALSGPAAGVVTARWGLLTGAPAVLTHGDYWSGNTVWERGTLTGVVDWSGGARGPRGADVGWCRLDLYLLSGEPVADTFLDAYQAASGFIMNDALTWDLWAVARSHDSVGSWVPNYRDLGRTDLTAGELRHRHRAWTDRLLARRRVGGRPAT